MATHKTLDVSVSEGVGTITIDHGELNLLDIAMIMDLSDAFLKLEQDPACAVVLFQSANLDFFIAHADLNLVRSVPAEPPTDLPPFQALVARLRSSPKPSIAKITGRARGGGFELALACDMRFGAIGHCVLGLPEVGGGLIPGGGGTVAMMQLAGYGRACEVVLGSGDFSAELAERYGLLNRALPADELDAYVWQLARRIARFPRHSVALGKQALRASMADHHAALMKESEFFAQSLTAETRADLEAAIQRGMQTRALELLRLDDIYEMAAAGAA